MSCSDPAHCRILLCGLINVNFCSSQVKLYITSEAASAFSGAVVNAIGGGTIPLSSATVGADPEPYISLPLTLLPATGDVPVTLIFTNLAGGATSVCYQIVGSFTVCPYTLNGSLQVRVQECVRGMGVMAT